MLKSFADRYEFCAPAGKGADIVGGCYQMRRIIEYAVPSRPVANFVRRGCREIDLVSEALQHVPALSFSGGPERFTLSFYSYFFYLDTAAQLQAYDALRAIRPKAEYAALAKRVAEDLGRFNAVHIRRGDFKKTKGVTTLDRKPAEAIETLDHHFKRDDRLVILTDEADDPFFDEIKSAYDDHIFLDHHILEHFGTEFMDLPAHDSIALAYLSQLVAPEALDFIGSMTSTFTSLIQRMRGNQRKDEKFKFLWNELPEPGEKLQKGRHAISNCVPLDRGIMVEDRKGPYSWNRCNERFNPGWMREWPESFLDETAMAERARDREVAAPGAVAENEAADMPQRADERICTISFLNDNVTATSDVGHIADTMKLLFKSMISSSDTPPIAKLRIADLGDQAQLLVDGKETGIDGAASRLLRAFYREVVCQFLYRHPELVWLHAGCAASAVGAVMLPGEWGRGKSTLVMELVKRDWAYLSDDIAPLDPDNGTIVPFPSTPQIRSRPDKELPRERLGSLRKKAASLDGLRTADSPHPLSMIIFPHYSRNETADLLPVSPGHAVGKLLENCLSFAKNEDESIHRLCKTVEKLPVYSLRFGDASEAVDLLIDVQKQEGQKVTKGK